MAKKDDKEQEGERTTISEQRKKAKKLPVQQDPPIPTQPEKVAPLHSGPLCMAPCPVPGCTGVCQNNNGHNPAPGWHYGSCSHQW
jgi:hypothetical protein